MIKRKILVITTKGCTACEVQERNVADAVKTVKRKNIIQQNKDWKSVDRSLLKNLKVKDYPTTIFTINDNCVFKCVGSYPVAVLVRWIDLYLK